MRAARISAILAVLVQVAGVAFAQGPTDELDRQAKILELHSIPKFNLAFFGGVDSKDGTFFRISANRHRYDNKKVSRLFLRGEQLREITETEGYVQGEPASILAFIAALKEERRPYQFYLDSVRSDLLTGLEEEPGEGQAAVDFFELAELVGAKSEAFNVLFDSLENQDLWRAHIFLASKLQEAEKALVKERLGIKAELPGNNASLGALLAGTYDPKEAIQVVQFEAEVLSASLGLLRKVREEQGDRPVVREAAEEASIYSANSFVTKTLVGLGTLLLGSQRDQDKLSAGESKAGQSDNDGLAMLREIRASTERLGQEWESVTRDARESSTASYLSAFMLAIEVSRWAEEDPQGTAEFFSELGDLFMPWLTELIEAFFEDSESPEAAKARLHELWNKGPGERFVEWRMEFRGKLPAGALEDAVALREKELSDGGHPGSVALRLLAALLLDDRWEETIDYFGGLGGEEGEERSGAVRAAEELAFSIFRTKWVEGLNSAGAHREGGFPKISEQLMLLEAELAKAGLLNTPVVRAALSVFRTGLMEVFRWGRFGGDAVLQAEELVEGYPRFLEAWLTLAEARVTKPDRDLEGAVYALERARAIAPEDPELTEIEGLLLAMKGDWSAALSSYRRAGGFPYVHHAHAEVCEHLVQSGGSTHSATELQLEAKREYLTAYTLYLEWLAGDPSTQTDTPRRWISMAQRFAEDCVKGFTADWDEMGEGLEERLFKARALAVLQAGPHAGAYANFAISQYKSWLVSAGESRGPVGARVAVSYGKLTFSHAKRLMRKGVPEGISPEEAKERGDLVRYLLRESLEALSSTAEAGGNLRGPNERMTVSEGPVDPVSLEAAIALMEIYVSIGDADKEESMRLFADELQTVADGFDFESVALSYANLGAELRSRGEHERSTYYFKESFNLSLRTLGEKHRLTTATASAALGSLRRGALLGTTELSALGAFVRGVPEGVRLPIDRSTQGQGELSGPQREEVHGVVTDLFYEHIFVGRVLEALAEERSLSKAQRDEGRWLAELRGDPTAADLNAVAWASVDPNIESAGADVEHALRLARAAATLSPTDAGVRDTLAWALFANGEHEAAVAASERALELAGSDDAREYQGTLETLRAKVKEAQAATEER